MWALRDADLRFAEERDRRYTEVGVEREKALKIKEEADKRALDLQAETQAYKDEKANELRSQIERERGAYVTQAELKPIVEFVNRQQGRTSGISSSAAVLYSVALIVSALLVYFLPHR
jgi:mevalonate kinase